MFVYHQDQSFGVPARTCAYLCTLLTSGSADQSEARLGVMSARLGLCVCRRGLSSGPWKLKHQPDGHGCLAAPEHQRLDGDCRNQVCY